MSRLGRSFRQRGVGSGRTLIQRAIASLRARGSDAHLWLPGGDVRTYGPELVVNGGPFTDTASWNVYSATKSVVSSELQVVATVAGGGAWQDFVLTAGEEYTVTGFARKTSSTTAMLVAQRGAAGGYAYLGQTLLSATSTAVGFSFTATGSDVQLKLTSSTGGDTFVLTRLSLKKITSITPTITNGLTTGNYLESTGNTLATVDNPTGLVLDALGGLGVELMPTGMTGATTNTGCSIVNGTVVMAGVAPGYAALADGTAGFVAGKTYKVTTTSVGVTGNCQVLFQGSAVTGAVFGTASTDFHFVAPAITNSRIQVNNSAGGAVSGAVSISVREVTGIHAQQGTTANKGLLRRGLTNLLTYSSDFSNAVWNKTDLSAGSWSVIAGVVDPIGGISAVTLPLTHGRFLRMPNVAVASGATFTQGLWVKRSASGGSNNIRLTTNNASAWNTGMSTKFALTDSWQLVAHSGVAQTGETVAHIIFGTVDASGASDATCLGNVDVCLALLTPGTLTAAQILAAGGIPVTTTAAASNPTSGKYSWQFDGSNDSLALGSVPFQQSDDWCVSIAATLTSAGSTRSLYSHSNASNHQVAWLKYADSGTVDWVTWDGSATVIATSPLTYVGTPIVIRMLKVGTSGTLWINGVQVATADFTLVISPALTTASIGSFGGIAMYHSGALTAPVVVKGTVTAAEALLIDRFVASTAGITL